MNQVYSEEYKGYRITVYQDTDSPSPRGEYSSFGECGFGSMICFHNRYDLGDKKIYDHEKYPIVFKEWIKKNKNNIVALPIYLFDHSGLRMDTDNQMFAMCDPHGWDWGMVGYIYATKDDIRKEFGVNKVTKKIKEKAINILKSEISEYDDYLSGNVYGYIITNVDGEEIDSCWGFYGDYDDYLMTVCKETIDGYVKEDEKVNENTD